MLFSLFINITIIVSFVLLIGQLYKRHNMGKNSPLKLQVLAGFAMGLLGICLLVYKIQITDIVIIDLRHLAIVLSTIIGGPVSVVISALMTAFFRVMHYGVNKASLLGFASILFIGVFNIWVYRWKTSEDKKYIISNTAGLFITIYALYLVIGNRQTFIYVLSYFIPLSLLGSVIIYFLVHYLEKTNGNFRELNYYRIMADNLTDMLVTHDPKGKIIYVSPSCRQLLGYNSMEIVGKNIRDLVHEDDRENIGIGCIRDMNNSLPFIVRMQRKTGEFIWIETVSKAILGKDGKAQEFICVSRDVSIRKQKQDELTLANNKLKQINKTDGLTQIFNRTYFDKVINREWDKGIRSGQPLSLLMIDIDSFKGYNDTYGHMQGDECLKAIGNTIKNSLNRSMDIAARYGGEEFGVILPQTDTEGAYKVAENIKANIKKLNLEHRLSKISATVTVSIGIHTLVPNKYESLKEFIDNTDKALYRAKELGRNRIERY